MAKRHHRSWQRRPWARRLVDETSCCFYCGKDVERTDRSVEHIYPIGWGGAHNKTNTTMACKGCNSRRRDMPILKFIAKFTPERRMQIYNDLIDRGWKSDGFGVPFHPKAVKVTSVVYAVLEVA